jgi:hypothetical protein
MKGQVLFKANKLDIITKIAKIGWGHLKIFFLRTTNPDKFRFTQKLPNIVEIQVCTNQCPHGLCWATMWKTIFTYVYIEKKNIFSITSKPISIKSGTNRPQVN